MRPILVRLQPPDLGGYLLALLAFFLFPLLWRRLERALGESVPELTAAEVLKFLLAAVGLVAGLWWLVNRLGGLEIRSYGFMLVVGFAAATAWCLGRARAAGFEPVVFLDLAIYVLVGGVVGARLVYVLLDWAAYRSHPGQILAVWEGGLSYHGGVLGAVLAGAVFARLRRQSFAALADVVAPGLALGYAFGRLGCFLNGCCYGRPTSLPWGVRFPHATWLDGRPIGGPVHPTQLYGSLASLLIFFILLRAQRLVRRPGDVFVLYLVLYSVYRFLIEWLRRGTTAAPFAPLPVLTVGQAASVVVGATGLMWLALTWPRSGRAGLGRREGGHGGQRGA
jgi:phosphatidylglycerol:prolipoprotein diacylglycerol transferase